MAKVSPRTYKLMWDAHSATGIVIGLALFVIFFTGALLLFRGEIRQWEEPALRAVPGERMSLDALTHPVVDSLGRGSSPPSYIYMGIPEGPHESLYVYLTGGTIGASHDVWVNPASGEWVGAPEQGAVDQILYYLHFFFQFGEWGLILAGLVSLFALLAITTGTVVHLNRLVKDFFQFRPHKKLRVAWADAHKVLGTIGLPFQAMYVFTGAYFGLVGLIALPYAAMLFDGNMADYYREAGYYAPHVQVDTVEASSERPRLEQLADRARRAWPDFEVETMIVQNMGASDSRVEVLGRQQGVVFGGTGSIVFHGATGEELLREPPHQAGALNQAVQSMAVLHFADFGGLTLKVLFFLLTLASSAVILTGNLTWLEVRRSQDRAIHTVLARLTAGVATGIVPAMALLFLADRWRPDAVADPYAWTNLVFFGSWLLSVLYALARRNIARTHRALLLAGGLLALLIPVANGLTTGDWPWVAWHAGRWAVLGVDAGAVLSGLAALGIAACLDVEATSTSPKAASPHNQQPPSASLPEETPLKTR